MVAALYSRIPTVILIVAGFRRGYQLGLISERHFVRLGFILAAFGATYLYLTFADLLPSSFVSDPASTVVFTDLLTGRPVGRFWLARFRVGSVDHGLGRIPGLTWIDARVVARRGWSLVHYPYMASIVGKKRGNQTYYYLVESARVNGKPRIVAQEYLGSAQEVMGRLFGAAPGRPERTQHKAFGGLAAVWGILDRLG